jgi:hypothetical protein
MPVTNSFLKVLLKLFLFLKRVVTGGSGESIAQGIEETTP